MENSINAWRQAGVAHLWRYKPEKRGYKGWYFTSDKDGLESAITLFELLNVASRPAKRTIKLIAPSDHTTNGPFRLDGIHNVLAATSMQIELDTDQPVDFWQWDVLGERVCLRLGQGSVAKVLDGLIERRAQGYGDFSVGPTKRSSPESIWFW